jgi:hypothetical protein
MAIVYVNNKVISHAILKMDSVLGRHHGYKINKHGQRTNYRMNRKKQCSAEILSIQYNSCFSFVSPYFLVSLFSSDHESWSNENTITSYHQYWLSYALPQKLGAILVIISIPSSSLLSVKLLYQYNIKVEGEVIKQNPYICIVFSCLMCSNLFIISLNNRKFLCRIYYTRKNPKH